MSDAADDATLGSAAIVEPTSPSRRPRRAPGFLFYAAIGLAVLLA